MQKLQYEGLNYYNLWVNGAQTAFFMGYNFSTQQFAINQGLDISLGSLIVDIGLGEQHPNLEIDVFTWCNAEVKTQSGGVALNF